MARTGWNSPLTAAVCATTLLAVGGVGAQQPPPAARSGAGAARAGSGRRRRRRWPWRSRRIVHRGGRRQGRRGHAGGVQGRLRSVQGHAGQAVPRLESGVWRVDRQSSSRPASTSSSRPPAGSAGGGAQNQTPKPEDLVGDDGGASRQSAGHAGARAQGARAGQAQGFVHSSIPLAAKTVEALGNKTKAWTTTITYDPADINAENLKQYDAIFLASTTGTFLDDPNDPAATTAREQGAARLRARREGPCRHPCRQ